ncbi:MAG TPA: ABC transporter ATP-binding protein [Candidatus Dormibacteraeota bacterium]|nr:ABC transporter ATP-binding protein [Candidatus Dormibacteraeota bacterium]
MLRVAWHFRRFLGPYWPALAGGACLSAAATAFAIAQPWPLKVMIDGAILRRAQHGWLAELIAGSGRDAQTVLLRALVALAVITVASAALDFAGDYLMSSAGQRVTVDVRQSLFAHLQRLSLRFHDRQRVGDLVSRVTLDIDRLQDMLVAIFDTLVPNFLMLGGLAIVMVWIDPSFGLLALCIAPLLFFVTYRYTLRIKRAVVKARLAEGGVAAHATETLAAMRLVQAFTREEHEDRRFVGKNEESLAAGLEAVRFKAAFGPAIDVVALLGTLLVTYVGVRQVIDGRLTVGLLLVYLTYLKSLYRPMRALSQLAYVVSRGTASADRVDEVLSADQQVPERSDARVLANLAGAIELRQVSMRYGPDRPPVLSNASLRIEPGETIGIVGRSGAGKSTLVGLLPRFHDPEQGVVLLDGVDVRDLRLAWLRRQISLVLQEPVIFHGSILDNVRYGDPEAPVERVAAAVEAANLFEFVKNLANGLLTQVGERGVALSGGERQRIAIARAILRNSPILLLDEPTTGLDVDNERQVLEALQRATEGRTTLIISHHWAVLRHAHRFIRVENGCLTEVSRCALEAGATAPPPD